MKRLGLIEGMMVLLLAACTVATRQGTSPPFVSSPELAAVDSLMWQQPDSALMRLLPYFNDTCRDVSRNVSETTNDDSSGDVSGNVSTTYNRHYANLLLAELLYKNDYAQTNRKELQRAVYYFDSLCCRDTARHASTTDPTIAFLDARAHYINGVGYYGNDSVLEACKEYLKTLDVMEGRFEEKELVGHKAQFMAFAYTRLTDVFSDFYIHEPSIYFAQHSVFYYQKQEGFSWHLPRMLSEIGAHYDMMDELDSAEYYYQNAKMALNDTNTILYRDIVSHEAYLEYKKDSLQANASLLLLFHILSRSENDLERLVRYSTISEIYYHEKQFDSAWHYLNMVYRETPNIGIKKQAAERLVNICKTWEKNTEILEYASFLVPFANQEENNSGLKTQLTGLYNAFRQKKMEQRNEETTKHQKYIVWIFVGLLTAMLSTFFLYRKRSKHKLEAQMETERQAHKMQQAALSGRLKQKNEELRELKGQIKRQEDLDETPNQAESFTDEPICRLIMERVKEGQFKSKVDFLDYKDYALNKQQLLDLRVAADQHFGQFTVRLKNAYPRLTNGDLDYCCLYLLGLTDAEIAALMQRAYNTVVERDSKLKKVFGNSNSLPLTLIGIAKKSYN